MVECSRQCSSLVRLYMRRDLQMRLVKELAVHSEDLAVRLIHPFGSRSESDARERPLGENWDISSEVFTKVEMWQDSLRLRTGTKVRT